MDDEQHRLPLVFQTAKKKKDDTTWPRLLKVLLLLR